MRVLFLDDAVFADLPGGSRMMARELAQGLVRNGHAVTFLVPHHRTDTPDEEWQEGVQIIRYPGAGKALEFVRRGREACANLWQQGRFDVVHTHFAYAALGPLQVIPADVPRVRSFYGPWDEEGWVEDSTKLEASQPHGSWKFMLRAVRNRVVRTLRHQIELRNLRQSDAIIILSEQSRQEVLSFSRNHAPMTKIPGGVDLERFTPASDRNSVRHRLGLPVGRRILLSVRRLMSRMGLDNLIEAMPIVSAQYPDALLLIGGKGPEHDRLAQKIAQHHLEDHVRLLGFIEDDQLPLYYQSADLFVLPTIALEGFGLVTVESMACGVPVVGTPIGATPEILNQIDPCLVTSGVEPAALARGILSFLESGRQQVLTPHYLHEFVQLHYSWKKNIQETERLYQTLLSHSSQGLEHKPV